MSARLVRDGMTSAPWTVDAEDAKRFLRPVRSYQEHVNLLTRKGFEEYGEMVTSASCDELAEEIGDMLDVLMATALLNGLPWETVLEKASAKRAKFGGFTEGLVWDTKGEQ